MVCCRVRLIYSNRTVIHPPTLRQLAHEPMTRKYSGHRMVIISNAVAILSFRLDRKNLQTDTQVWENVNHREPRVPRARPHPITTVAPTTCHDFEWMSKLCAITLPNASVPSCPSPSFSTQLRAPAVGMAPAPRPTE